MTLHLILPAFPEGYEDRMPRHTEAAALRRAGWDALGREALLEPSTADAWMSMRSASAAHGLDIYLVSTFRSIARQRELIAAKLAAGMSLSEILSVNAYPGFSEHHTGRAIDVGAPGCADLTEAFDQTAEFAWLTENAPRFGFALTYPRNNPFGIAYEPWHWCRTA